jgi:nitrile hydratase subunit alpha
VTDIAPEPAHAATNAERTEALEALLTEAGYVTAADIDRIVDRFQNDIGPMVGARMVARAWVDPDYRQQLLDDADAVLAELDAGDAQTEHLVVVENTENVHNVVVCTLCSCYPWAVLGLPPAWYKDPSYRSRVVREPRAVLAEMGLALDAGTEIQVWDSSAEVRYLVLPRRPAGTDGLGVDDLAALVNRDSMIGVAQPDSP